MSLKNCAFASSSMKKHLLLLTISFLTLKNFVAQTNVYHPFPDSNAVWHQHEHPSGGPDNHFQFGILGDTVINSLVWHKLYQEQNCIPDPVITIYNSTLVGAIREDSLKQVFFYNISYWSVPLDSVYKLYDFSKQSGDTIVFGPAPAYNSPALVVDSTDSVFTYNQYRKRFYFTDINGGMPEIWIEGIGSKRNLLSIIDPYPTCSCLLELFCFRQNDTSFYIKSPFLDCYDLTAGIGENEQQINSANIFPNPFSTETTVSASENLSNATLIIYNSLGQQVKQQKNISGQTITLHRDNLPNGIYFLQIIKENKVYSTNKLVITGGL
ncbi:MAG: T9SS type A sorting domain-containing protein [Bacteroidia bacterium]|nr:T9SS type A sorting domain-containing protein [Bacteroidia bacterium]